MFRRGQASVIGAVFLAIIFSIAALLVIQMYSSQQGIYQEALKAYKKSSSLSNPSLRINYTYPAEGNVTRDLSMTVLAGGLNCSLENLESIDGRACEVYGTGPVNKNFLSNGDFSNGSSYWHVSASSDGSLFWVFRGNATLKVVSATWVNATLSQTFSSEREFTIYYVSLNYSSRFYRNPTLGESYITIYLDGEAIATEPIDLSRDIVSSINVSLNRLLSPGEHNLSIFFNATYRLGLVGTNYHNFSVDDVVLYGRESGKDFKASVLVNLAIPEDTVNLTSTFYLFSNVSAVARVYSYDYKSNSYKLAGEYYLLPGLPANISVGSASNILEFRSESAFKIDIDYAYIRYLLLNRTGFTLSIMNPGPGQFQLNGVWIRHGSDIKRINVTRLLMPLHSYNVSVEYPLSFNEELEIRLVGTYKVYRFGRIKVYGEGIYFNTSTLHIQVYPADAGSTNPSPGNHTYITGTSVAVTALETNPSYQFSHWLLNGSLYSSSKTVTVRVNGFVNLTAIFEEVSAVYYYLNVSVNDETFGTTDPAPGVYSYPVNTNVDIRALPNPNHILWTWVVDGSNNSPVNPLSVVMDNNHTVMAVFEPWLEGWQYRRKIKIQERSGSTLTNYQVRIQLTSSNFDFSKAKPDGSDIRFTASDKLTLLPYWIERWDSRTGNAVIWVKVPSIPAGGTVYIYMYYGNPSATSTSDLADVMERLPASDGAGYRIYYQEWVMPSNLFQTIGRAMNWRADDYCWTYNLPFALPYYSSRYSRVYVCSNGFLDMLSRYADYTSTEREFKARRMIAPFWADLRTDRGGNIYIDNSYSDEYGSGVYIRWRTRFYYNNGQQNIAVVLYNSGLIRFDYGTIYGNSLTDDTPVIGVSFGDKSHYTLSSYNGVQYPSRYNSVMFWPRKKASVEPSVTVLPEETLP